MPTKKKQPITKAVFNVEEGLPEIPETSQQRHTIYHSRDAEEPEKKPTEWNPIYKILDRINKALETPKE
jgi:hypothetical protein